MPATEEEEEEALPASSSEQLRRLHDKVGEYYAAGYLATWCGGAPRREWAQFLHRVFGDIVPRSARGGSGKDSSPVVFDVGCGPSIASVISASRWSDRIYLCDYLESNR